MKRTLKQKEKLTGPEPRATISVAAVEQWSNVAVKQENLALLLLNAGWLPLFECDELN